MSEDYPHDLCAASEEGHQKPASGGRKKRDLQEDDDGRELIWRQIQESIKERLGLQRFGIWFKQTELMHLDGTEMVVGVPNVITKQYLEKKYSTTLQQSAGELLGEEPEIRFDVAPKLLRRMRRQQQQEERSEAMPGASPPADRRPQDKERPKKVRREEPDHSFENLVVTGANSLPFLAAREITTREDPQFDFLLVLGEHGVGKSALLQAAYHAARGAEVCTACHYSMAEKWCNDYYHALQCRKTRPFRRRHRNCDLLIVDGVHFLQGKPAAQDELLHTAKTIQAAGGRLILSASEHPHELKEAKESFQNLLCGAFWVELVNPPVEERVEVARRLGKRLSLRADERVFEFIAGEYGSSMRELHGSVCSLAAAASLQELRGVGLTAAQEILGTTRGKCRRQSPGMAQICEAVLESFSVSEEDLRGRSRRRNACRARQAAMYLARELTDLSLSDVGRHFGGRTHGTVSHSVQQAEKHRENTPQFAEALQKARKALGAG